MNGGRTQVFISYSHSDKEWLERLRIHLKPLVRESTINIWDDTQIPPGAKWRAEKGGAIIIPIIVSPSRFPHIKNLARFQAVNDPSMPLVSFP